MLLRQSRYHKPRAARRFSAGADGEPDFPGIRPRAIGPASGVIEHTIAKGERLDALAHYYYRDSRLWWRIIDANPDLLFAGVILLDEYAGETLLIPRARE
ncbi:hypothetical protein ACN2MM_09495 [Alkalilimnicola ehrlichii MLHE-1]|uniref:LysM domain-containing protein n=1 Tax=Alkalilimnicola ehrlichii (strain ATCC BAA-1101 / DSM 17681 / MLHE-1) TaxID=187272 RepID=Q0A7U1_ALKEH|nr:hypothetical protein [Alkalilimnicola ehrlichii]ABI57096.1 conserved hypothetical protein [Alkalilimnicola ehrlichii MLHE-1]